MPGDFERQFVSDDEQFFQTASAEVKATLRGMLEEFTNVSTSMAEEFKKSGEKIKTHQKLREDFVKVVEAKAIDNLADLTAEMQKFQASAVSSEKAQAALSQSFLNELAPAMNKIEKIIGSASEQSSQSLISIRDEFTNLFESIDSSFRTPQGAFQFLSKELPMKIYEMAGHFTDFIGNKKQERALKNRFKTERTQYRKFYDKTERLVKKHFSDTQKKQIKFYKKTTKSSDSMVKALNDVNKSFKKVEDSAEGAAGAMKSGGGGKRGKVVGAGGWILGMVTSVLNTAFQLAFEYGERELAKMETLTQSLAKQGMSLTYSQLDLLTKSKKGYVSVLDDLNIKLGEITLTSKKAAEVVGKFAEEMVGVANILIEGRKFTKQEQKAISEMERMGRTILSGINYQEFFADFIAYNEVAFEEVIPMVEDSLANMVVSGRKFAKMTGSDIVQAFQGAWKEGVKLNFNQMEAAGLTTNLVQNFEELREVGIDLRQSLGSLTKELMGSFKKWGDGLKAFVGIKAFGPQVGGDIFKGMYKAEFGTGKELSDIYGPLVNMAQQITAGMGKEQEIIVGRMFYKQVAGLGDEAALAMAKAGPDIIGDPEAMKKLQEDQKEQAKSSKQHLATIDDKMDKVAKIMLDIRNALNKVFMHMMSTALSFIGSVLTTIATSLKVIISVLTVGLGKLLQGISMIPGIPDSLGVIGAKISGFGERGFATLGDDIKLVGSQLSSTQKNFDKLVASLENLKNIPDKLKDVSGILEADVTKTGITDVIESTSMIIKGPVKVLGGLFGTDKSSVTKKHFGGYIPKHHNGIGSIPPNQTSSIIKKNEMGIINGEGTQILSPADTRQTMQETGKSVTVHVNFNGDVLGMPRFEEAVKRIIGKAAASMA